MFFILHQGPMCAKERFLGTLTSIIMFQLDERKGSDLRAIEKRPDAPAIP